MGRKNGGKPGAGPLVRIRKRRKRKATNAHVPVFRPGRPSWLCSYAGSWLSLMATGVFVLMMSVIVSMFMSMDRGFVAVLMAVVAMSYRVVSVLMFMLVFGMAAHCFHLLFLYLQ
jgi:hypothetical protein